MPYSLDKKPSVLFRERPWVFFYGSLLSGCAGYINVVMLGVYHVPVSHMTGATSRIAIDLASGNSVDMTGAMEIFFGFLCGAIISGILIGGTQVQPGRRYGIAMMIEGGILACSFLLLFFGSMKGIPLAALACGLQNGMACSYCGLVIRTTHVSGMVTDIGVLIGQMIRYRHLEFWKLALLGSLLSGFFLGGVLGGYSFATIRLLALLPPALGCFIGGAIYFDWRRRNKNDLPLDRWGYFPPEERQNPS
jgi:uncharacterized membrane protein YoaK (UPF0700 family)